MSSGADDQALVGGRNRYLGEAVTRPWNLGGTSTTSLGDDDPSGLEELASPDAVLFATGNSLVETSVPDRTLKAQGLGGCDVVEVF